MSIYIDKTAHVSDKAKIGDGTKIWINVQIREEAEIGTNCIISKDAYIDHAVKIGNNVKIQNGVSVYNGTLPLPMTIIRGPAARTGKSLRQRSKKELPSGQMRPLSAGIHWAVTVWSAPVPLLRMMCRLIRWWSVTLPARSGKSAAAVCASVMI